MVASVVVANRPKMRSNVLDAVRRKPTVEVGAKDISPWELAALNEKFETN